MTSCEHNFSRIFSTTTCCLRLRESLSKLSLFDVIATADTCQCNACASNDTCQCIAAVLVLVVAQTNVDCINLFEPSGMLESSSHVF